MSKSKYRNKSKFLDKEPSRHLSPSQLRALKRKQRLLTKTEVKNNGISN